MVLFNSLKYSIKYRFSQVFLSPFSWRNPANQIGTIFQHLLCMKCSFTSGKSLYDHPGILVQ